MLPKKRHSSAQIKELWLFFFILGLVMLNYPFLLIFDKINLFFGFPLSVLYILFGWPLSIVVIYFFSRSLNFDQDQTEEVSRSDQGSSI